MHTTRFRRYCVDDAHSTPSTPRPASAHRAHQGEGTCCVLSAKCGARLARASLSFFGTTGSDAPLLPTLASSQTLPLERAKSSRPPAATCPLRA
eukprot:scaffold231917_cov31-Tisochrysis_lutea.AAC.2